MNVATTYQLKKMVIVQNFKNLMFKPMRNSHQHLYLRKTKGHIQGLLQSNKGRRYKKHFSCLSISKIFYAQFGFKLKHRGIKLLYLVI